jgi:hypothetical protein
LAFNFYTGLDPIDPPDGARGRWITAWLRLEWQCPSCQKIPELLE